MMKLSIRKKLLILTSAIPVLTLSIYLFLAINLFERDKIAYVFDSNLSLCRTFGAQLNSQLEGSTTVLDSINTFYRSGEHTLTPTARNIFTNQTAISSLVIYQEDFDGQYRRAIQLRKQGK